MSKNEMNLTEEQEKIFNDLLDRWADFSIEDVLSTPMQEALELGMSFARPSPPVATVSALKTKDEIRERLGRSPGRGDAWKMLQWAFSRELVNSTYKIEAYKLQKYAISDLDMEGIPFRRPPDMWPYAITS